MPIGILGSLVICTILYIAFGFVLTGLVNYKDLQNDAHPVVTAISQTPFHWLKTATTLGVIGGFTTVMLVMLLGQSRVFYAMSRDGLLPKVFSTLHPQWKTPWISNLIFMAGTGLLGGFVPIEVLGHMTSIGTLLAFIIVCAGVVVLRKTHPEPRARLPGALGALHSSGGNLGLPRHDGIARDRYLDQARGMACWWGWLIFFGFSRTHSKAARTAAMQRK